MEQILKILEKNARISLEDLAIMTQRKESEVAAIIDDLTAKKAINGYRTLIDWEKADINHVQAIIEVRVTPRRDCGFEQIATVIAEYDEVDSVLLMSGGYDLSLVVKGKTFQDIALFVSKRLSILDGVLSTATHFVLRTYKKDGAMYLVEIEDERESVK